MENWQERTERLIGKENIQKIENIKIVILGVGGVGGFVFESLVRSGVKNIAIVNEDKISYSNINRQIIANLETIGKYKTDEIKKRAEKINENINVYNLNVKLTKDNLESIIEYIEKNIGKIDYIIDAIDDIPVKIENIIFCKKKNIKCITSMGAGFKLDTRKIKDEPIFKTKTCKLAKKIRSELKRFLKSEKNVNSLKEKDFKDIIAVYSEEETINTKEKSEVASMIFVPASFGIRIAEIVIRDIIDM